MVIEIVGFIGFVALCWHLAGHETKPNHPSWSELNSIGLYDARLGTLTEEQIAEFEYWNSDLGRLHKKLEEI